MEIICPGARNCDCYLFMNIIFAKGNSFNCIFGQQAVVKEGVAGVCVQAKLFVSSMVYSIVNL